MFGRRGKGFFAGRITAVVLCMVGTVIAVPE